MEVKKEFREGSNNIGYLYSEFYKNVIVEDFQPKSAVGKFQTLKRSMADVEIEGELKPGYCTLGDVFALLKSEDKTFRDGNLNLFYLSSCVVRVDWLDGRWRVHAWRRGGARLVCGPSRVFSRN